MKVADFQWDIADASRTQDVGHMIYIYIYIYIFGSSLSKVWLC